MEYETRRQQLIEQMQPNSVAIVIANNKSTPFRQDSDFHYLTGLKEANALLLLAKNQDGSSNIIIFVQEQDQQTALWVGATIGVELAGKISGINKAYGIAEVDRIIPDILNGKDIFYYLLGKCKDFDDKVISWLKMDREGLRRGKQSPDHIIDLSSLLHEMRLIKSVAEIDFIKKACNISAAGHLRIMENCTPQKMEYHLEADFSHHCATEGCRTLAYPSIVGSGNNGCVLHYTVNDQPLCDGDLVLVDAGCEYKSYASDITRTFPVNGTFSKEQCIIYELVLQAQAAGLKKVRPGTAWNQIQDSVVEVLVDGLLKLKLLHGQREHLIETQAYKQFYPHSSGHWIGLDVHDAGKYMVNGQSRILEPGMLLTVEPGLYFSSEQKDIDQRWRGIAVRIEDVVLVTDDGHEILTSTVPKTISEIEAIMKG